MVSIFTLAFLLLVATYFSEASFPICVVGGGLSGLVIATRLQQKGYNVELYEAAERFGGKLDTYRGNNARLEKGPIIFTNIERFTNDWLNAYRMEIIEYNVTDHAILFPNGMTAPIKKLDPKGKPYRRICDLTDKYKIEWARYPESTWSDFGYSTVDFERYPELAGSIDDWLRDRGLEELSSFFIWFITIEGYGDIRLTPALYALKLIGAPVADFFFELGLTGLTVKDGFDEFARRISLGIYKKWTGWELTNILRWPDGLTQTLTFNVEHELPQIRTCSKTVLAFPPTRSKTRNLLSHMTELEGNVLKAVQVKKFAASGLNIPSLKPHYRVYIILLPSQRLNYSIVPQFQYPAGDGSLLAIARQDKAGISSHFAGYSWIYGDYDHKADDSDLQIMRKEIDELMQNVDPFYKLFYIKATDYFPHVPSEAILQGFYKNLRNIQGNGGVYWATTLLTFESINHTIEMAEKVVGNYF